jgi:hypothetical protein
MRAARCSFDNLSITVLAIGERAQPPARSRNRAILSGICKTWKRILNRRGEGGQPSCAIRLRHSIVLATGFILMTFQSATAQRMGTISEAILQNANARLSKCNLEDPMSQ